MNSLPSQHIKRLLLAFCFTSFLLSSCSPSTKSEDNSNDAGDYHKIRILTYNIQHGNTTSGKIDMNLYAQIIKEQNPDIVALQEVDKEARRSGNIDETAELAKLTGLDGYFGKYRDYQGGEFGDAILSKLPVLDFKVIPANSSLDKVPRAYLFAKVKVADDLTITFNDSHLSHTIKEQTTIQAKELVDYWKEKLDKGPLIIAGDLNSTPNSDALNVLLKHFKVSDQHLNPTFSARTSPKKKIDYILYPKNRKWKVFNVKRICKKNASDHCAILTVLGIKNQE